MKIIKYLLILSIIFLFGCSEIEVKPEAEVDPSCLCTPDDGQGERDKERGILIDTTKN